MVGCQDVRERLFYTLRLKDHVPGNHFLRQLEAVLNVGRVRSVLASHYSSAGRPSIDPELMLRILSIGYVYGIRSERQLCSEVPLNLAYRWFCRLGPEGVVPDHSCQALSLRTSFLKWQQGWRTIMLASRPPPTGSTLFTERPKRCRRKSLTTQRKNSPVSKCLRSPSPRATMRNSLFALTQTILQPLFLAQS
jgi:hypothetical protein